jgi:hypothetical protein
VKNRKRKAIIDIYHSHERKQVSLPARWGATDRGDWRSNLSHVPSFDLFALFAEVGFIPAPQIIVDLIKLFGEPSASHAGIALQCLNFDA